MEVRDAPRTPERLRRSIGRGILWGLILMLALIATHALAVALSGGNAEHALGGMPLVIIPAALVAILVGVVLIAPLRQLVARVSPGRPARAVGALLFGATIVGLLWRPAPPGSITAYNAPDELVEVVLQFISVTVVVFFSVRTVGEATDGARPDRS